jgi:hypothetical protein
MLRILWTISYLLLIRHLANAAPFPGTNSSSTPSKLYLPQNDPNPAQRSVEIETNRRGYIYAPSLIGNTSFFIGGDLGATKVQSEIAVWFEEQETLAVDAPAERASAMSAVIQVCVLHSMFSQIFLTLMS